jgi:peptidoglycan hydrolase-like protein with peptidoglycan-binding domain
MRRARVSLRWVIPIAVAAIAGGVAAGVSLGHKPSAGSLAPTTAAARSTGTTAGASTAPPKLASSGVKTPTPKPAPLVVRSVIPSPKATNVPPESPITLRFSTTLAPSSPKPVVSPSIQGNWSIQGSTMTFQPSVPFLPLSTVTVIVPAGPAGPHSQAGGLLAAAYRTSFQVKDGSIFRLDQLLSLLDYSPLSWTPTGTPIAPNDTSAQLDALYKAPLGHFAWRQAGWPTQLTALWQPGVWNVMTRGLVMSFQADHGLEPNGVLTPSLWQALLSALAQHEQNTGGYNFALASKVSPESLTIWHDGRVVLHALANTGIPQSPTDNGVFPVYSRLRSQVMQGTNPNGSHYADPVQYVAYFNGGDAVHYIPRAQYGFPQSLGCVELDLGDAARAWPYLAYGTLVDVIG